MARHETCSAGNIARAFLIGAGMFALLAGPASAQKSGGVLRLFHRDSPASMSIHEEATISTVGPTMAVFNNLVLFNQHEKQNRMEFIEPELAESWNWNEDHTRLSFRLRQGVKWRREAVHRR
jgi:peptide/nickel transport system substrate-binding protein